MPGSVEAILKNPREVFLRMISDAKKKGEEFPPPPDFGKPTTPRDRLLDATFIEVYQGNPSTFSGASDDEEVLAAAKELGIIA